MGEWTTEELRRDFEVIGFMAPYVHVRRKADGVEGSLEFIHEPRLYFNFVPFDKEDMVNTIYRHLG